MKAVLFHEHGGPEVLKYEDAPDPKPGRGDVLIDVKATSINHIDIFLRRGMPGVRVPLPKIAGCDAADASNIRPKARMRTVDEV